MAEVKGLTYMAEIYDEIFKYAPLNAESRALEVGIGFGQATAPILATGASVTALEPNEDVANVCKEIFAENKNLTVMTEKFEDFTAENESFDLVYSASAFHEVKQDIGYTKAYALLKKGGVLILSGIIESRLEMVINAYENVGMQLEKQVQKGEWFALVMKRER